MVPGDQTGQGQAVLLTGGGPLQTSEVTFNLEKILDFIKQTRDFNSELIFRYLDSFYLFQPAYKLSVLGKRILSNVQIKVLIAMQTLRTLFKTHKVKCFSFLFSIRDSRTF